MFRFRLLDSSGIPSWLVNEEGWGDLSRRHGAGHFRAASTTRRDSSCFVVKLARSDVDDRIVDDAEVFGVRD